MKRTRDTTGSDPLPKRQKVENNGKTETTTPQKVKAGTDSKGRKINPIKDLEFIKMRIKELTKKGHEEYKQTFGELEQHLDLEKSSPFEKQAVQRHLGDRKSTVEEDLKDVFKDVQKFFQKAGHEIPEEILNHYKPEEGIATFISNEEATSLRDLAIKVSREKYPQGIAQFQLRDLVLDISQKRLHPADKKAFLSISRAFRNFSGASQEKRRVVLTSAQALDPDNERLKFAVENNLKIAIEIEDTDLEKMKNIMAMPDPVHAKMLENLEVCTLSFNINENNQHTTQEFIDLLGQKCPNLNAFSVENIEDSINLSFAEMKNLAHLTIDQLEEDAILKLTGIDNLVELTFLYLGSGSKVTLPSSMDSLVDLYIHLNFQDETVTLPTSSMKKLSSFTLSGVGPNSKITNLSSIDNVTQLFLANIEQDLKLPEEFNKLSQLKFEGIDDDNLKETLARLQKQIASKQS